ncbi:MAG: ATP-grasp domain-containing protein [Candidatus Aureabacteria bacterium]|nr:ATP-grasp domain-containing protein [Candidatus Auribacterota bacterium]
MRVGLAFNRKPQTLSPQARHDHYAEWDDADTIKAVAGAIATRHSVIEIEADEAIAETLKRARPDIVFNIAEGINSPSRESQVPIICEMLRIPYTGSDGFTLAACLNKARAKEIMSYHHIPTPPFEVIEHAQQRVNGLRFPVIIKPLWEGSSMGIRNDALIFERSELPSRLERLLKEYRQPVLVESYLSGREFTVALLGNGEDVRVLPIVEINFGELPAGAHPIYSYEAKWIWDTPERPLRIFACPAGLDDTLRARIEELCIRAFRALGCRDWCRVDVRLDAEGSPHVIELNPLPGILPDPDENSCFPKAARAAGMSYHELILEVLSSACARMGLP